MELYILNQTFQRVAAIDQYSSLIWARRYWKVGDFEIYIPADPDLLQYLQIGFYVFREDCESTMMIEHIEIKTDVENGNYFIISGRGVENILSYRVVANAGGFAARTPSIMCEYLIRLEAKGLDMKYADREIDIIKTISRLAQEDELWIGNSFIYQNLLDAVFSLCKQYGFSFKFLLTNEKDGFDVVFFRGIDRTLGQTKNPPVIFSPKYYNLINSQYVLDAENNETMAFIAGEGEGADRSVIWTHKTWNFADEHNVPKQLDRREIFVDARDLRMKKDDGTYYTAAEYGILLRQRGKEKLFETGIIEGLSGEVDTTLQFIYRRDWDLGDLVSIENEYGMKANARILEVIEADDENGYRVTPTFSDWEMKS